MTETNAKSEKAAQREASKKLLAALKPGQVLTRIYKGSTIKVKVLSEGFKYNGTTYPSLSAVARAITGYKTCDGIQFFKLKGDYQA